MFEEEDRFDDLQELVSDLGMEWKLAETAVAAAADRDMLKSVVKVPPLVCCAELM